jgi:hypothetical protein
MSWFEMVGGAELDGVRTQGSSFGYPNVLEKKNHLNSTSEEWCG